MHPNRRAIHPEDEEAQALIEAEGYDIEKMPLRHAVGAERWVRSCELGPFKFPVPDLGTLFGWRYEARYHYLPGQNAFVIPHRDRPPTIISIDPDLPMGEEEPTPPRAYRLLRKRMEQDLQGVPRPDPDVRP